MNTTAKGHRGGALGAALVSIILLHQGCAGPAPGVGGRGPGVHPGIIVLTGEQARNAGYPLAPGRQPAGSPTPGASTSQGEGTAPLRPPVVRAYQVGRTRDPADPRLLHEAHTVYRIEEDGDWELDPKAAVQAGEGAPADRSQKGTKGEVGQGIGPAGGPQEQPQAGAPQAR